MDRYKSSHIKSFWLIHRIHIKSKKKTLIQDSSTNLKNNKYQFLNLFIQQRNIWQLNRQIYFTIQQYYYVMILGEEETIVWEKTYEYMNECGDVGNNCSISSYLLLLLIASISCVSPRRRASGWILQHSSRTCCGPSGIPRPSLHAVDVQFQVGRLAGPVQSSLKKCVGIK